MCEEGICAPWHSVAPIGRDTELKQSMTTLGVSMKFPSYDSFYQAVELTIKELGTWPFKKEGSGMVYPWLPGPC